jgi:hypothetical protein
MPETDTSTSSQESGTTEETGSESEERDFYVAQDGMRGRDGGPYLDQIEREQGEVLRARREDREPDFDDLQPVAGTVLVTGTNLTDNVQSNPSMNNQVEEVNPVTVNEELVTPLTMAVDTRTVAPEDADTETSASPHSALPESNKSVEDQQAAQNSPTSGTKTEGTTPSPTTTTSSATPKSSS